ncbi:hypothetical protein [Isorropodon fossajaponicum symbiont]|uniref:hypothetical protein n=1 Tax=Isorropodon fossajaponicum symbiont TaxID=883811 RepID=UPI0019156347|nr:hypothetical protein [Isorropodon fossajaponicum symbiont]
MTTQVTKFIFLPKTKHTYILLAQPPQQSWQDLDLLDGVMIFFPAKFVVSVVIFVFHLFFHVK